jgi:hypothetical protein
VRGARVGYVGGRRLVYGASNGGSLDGGDDVRRGRDDDTGSVSGIASRCSRLTHQRADVDRCNEIGVEERGRVSWSFRDRVVSNGTGGRVRARQGSGVRRAVDAATASGRNGEMGY